MDKWNYDEDFCIHENESWCDLPKYKRCIHCMRLTDGSKACEMTEEEYKKLDERS